MKEIFENPKVIFYIFLFVSLIITRLPLIGKYFRGINTMVHESGHAIIALLLSGKVYRIDLSSDTSGSVLTATDNGIKKFLVSFSGYPISSMVAFAAFYFVEQKAFQYIIYPLVGLAILNLILYVRNLYGIFWLLSFLAISIFIIYINIEMLWFGYALLCSLILLTDAFISTLHLFIINIKEPKKAGDSSNLAEISGLPSIFWTLVFISISGYLAYKTIWMFFPKLF